MILMYLLLVPYPSPGMRYHPIDIETSVLRCHRSICECAVFTWTNLLVVVVELDGSENEALDLIPLVTNAVLEEHYLIVGTWLREGNWVGKCTRKVDYRFWRVH